MRHRHCGGKFQDFKLPSNLRRQTLESPSTMAGLALRSLDLKLAAFRRSVAYLGIKLSTTRSTARHLRTERCFTSLTSVRQSVPARSLDFDDSPMPLPESTPETSAAGNSGLPWYLKVQSPRPKLAAQHPFADRQKLPELPTNSPPSLQGMLEHISVELGLDNLTLLDLRQIDPPPALGANLIMIIGTARSEKHLHVSADRFCRWLRSTHKLRPYADGLLGRNELKLKMRRKNRRSRLLASVGATMKEENVDDGIRTGWICIRAGRVEPAATAQEVAPEDQQFVGFGESSRHVTIVVQMFTEEKRADVDLEGLWEDVLERAKRRQEHQQTVHGEGAAHETENEKEAQFAAEESVDLRAQSYAPKEVEHTYARI